MDTYETPEGVQEYIEMCKGSDFSEYKDVLLKHIPAGSRLLEVGMGPGNDYAWMSKVYKSTGSDYSEEFLKRAQERFPEAQFLQLDARTLDTRLSFDAIFSCKVYQHYDLQETKAALQRQHEVLGSSGVVAHAFWTGAGVSETHKGMTFYYHTKEDLVAAVAENFLVLEAITYEEFEPNDSVLIIAKKE
eukprot:TRINITY_DN5308_c0_g1_i1.p1 TRINITY_DN5308_c0_g1~~TRINITY_DN5308_c0_g1_i1.p1  ORF type:complete len:203 (+),score=71.70 TRINITY_DN5308_c0_g1_i1:43-609(+)